MAEVYDMKQIDGDIHQMYPQTCPATVMIGMFTCCTMKIEYTNKVIDEDTVAGVGAKICGCLPWSPLPCCTYCGVGPCAGEFRFKRKEPGSNVWVGTGCPFAGCPTACASCDQCSHNNDEFTIDEQHNGKTAATAAYMTPGGTTGNGFTPPCIAGPCSCCNNKDLFGMVVKGQGPPVKASAPANTMER